MVISRLVPLLLALTLSPSAVSAQDTALEAGASLGDVAQTFGQVAQDFGDVTAVATPAMTLLNTAPGTPDIYADLSPGDALKLLAATLSPAQWRLLIGPQGIGQDDLTTNAQHSLFMAQFPGGVLKVEPQHSPLALQTNRHEGVRDLTGDLPHTCLRLRREVLLTLPSLQNPGSAFMIFEPDTPGTPHYGPARWITIGRRCRKPSPWMGSRPLGTWWRASALRVGSRSMPTGAMRAGGSRPLAPGRHPPAGYFRRWPSA